MTDVRVWVDGALVNPVAPAISALDHGLTVGDGAFETVKVVDGRAFALTRHLGRLDRSLTGLGLAPADHEVVRAGVAAVLADGGTLGLGRLRVTVTAGPGPAASDREEPVTPTHVVAATPLARPPASGAAVTVPWTRNERSATTGLKTTSYADNVVALAFARARGAGEAILGNTRGELCEGTGSNVFVVLDGVVRTPPLRSGCLAGITRELALEWSRAAGIEVLEQSLPLDVLRTCEEVFLTSTTRDVFAVDRVDGRALPAPGPLTAAVATVFAAGAAHGDDP